jgi:hypothetical protein
MVPVAVEGLTVAVKVTAWPGVAELEEAVRVVVDAALLMTSVTGGEVLVLLLASPLYVAVSEWLPTARLEVVKLAVPPPRAAMPRVAEPSWNVTVPVTPEGVTVAVRVTAWPGVARFGEATRMVVDGALFTSSVTGGDVLALLLASPLYTAVSVWLPTARPEVLRLALPLLKAWLPIVALPSRKVTVPVAVAGVTVAVSVTAWPGLAGFGEADRVVVVALRPTVSVTAEDVLPL